VVNGKSSKGRGRKREIAFLNIKNHKTKLENKIYLWEYKL